MISHIAVLLKVIGFTSIKDPAESHTTSARRTPKAHPGWPQSGTAASPIVAARQR
jgi:hypothetical protein